MPTARPGRSGPKENKALSEAVEFPPVRPRMSTPASGFGLGEEVGRVRSAIIASRPAGWWNAADEVPLMILAEAVVRWRKVLREMEERDLDEEKGMGLDRLAKTEGALVNRILSYSQKLRLLPSDKDRTRAARRVAQADRRKVVRLSDAFR